MIIGVSNRKDIICSPQAAGFWKGRKCIMSKKIINFLRKYKYMILVLYFPIYMLWFNWLERRQVPHFAMIHCRLDDMIPFCEWFAIPYFLWFLYVFVSIIFLFLQSKHMSDFYRCSAVLMLGMTTCLIIYTIFQMLSHSAPMLCQETIF